VVHDAGFLNAGFTGNFSNAKSVIANPTGSLLGRIDDGGSVDTGYERTDIAVSSSAIPTEPDMGPVTTAALLLTSRAVRIKRLRDNHLEIDDVSWHILLELMVSMDAGKAVTMHDAVSSLNVAPNTMTRYVAYLAGMGLTDEGAYAVNKGLGQLALTATDSDLAIDVLEEIARQLVHVSKRRLPGI